MHAQTSVPGIEEFTALVAIEIDRTRLGIADGSRRRALASQLPAGLGLSPAGMQLLPLLRNMLPDRSVPLDALRACERYVPDSTYKAAMTELVTASVVHVDGSNVALTSRGCDVAREVHNTLAAEVNERWGQEVDFAGLEILAQRALEVAAATGGPSFAVMAPPYDPPLSTSGSRSAERLACLRIHRGDAHADAWASAGLTVEQIQVLEPGHEREAIERETNRRASGPYEALTLDERVTFLDSLRGLPS